MAEERTGAVAKECRELEGRLTALRESAEEQEHRATSGCWPWAQRRCRGPGGFVFPLVSDAAFCNNGRTSSSRDSGYVLVDAGKGSCWRIRRG